jgi:predicted metal-dependent phosphoesterase TrpH
MRADLHIHSFHSKDNHQTAQEIFKAAENSGLGAIAITDHNTVVGAMEALRMAPEGLIVLPGIEITSKDGHILALNVEQDIPRDLSVQETIGRIHAAGGIAVAAHPYRTWSGLKESTIRENRFDAIEAINGRNTRKNNHRVQNLALELELPMIAGSDAHRPGNIGAAVTVFADSVHSREEMISAILNKQVLVDGSGRHAKETISYGGRSIAKWMRRGMKRL